MESSLQFDQSIKAMKYPNNTVFLSLKISVFAVSAYPNDLKCQIMLHLSSGPTLFTSGYIPSFPSKLGL